MPLFCATSCLSVEIAYIIFSLQTIANHRYNKNCFLILSRINVSFAIIVINMAAIYLALTEEEEGSQRGAIAINFYDQITVMFVILSCITIELILLVVYISKELGATAIRRIRNMNNKEKALQNTESSRGCVWMIPPRVAASAVLLEQINNVEEQIKNNKKAEI